MNDIENLFSNKTFEGIMIIIDNKMDIINVNVTFSRLLGYSENEAKTMNFTDLIVPDEKSLFFDVMYRKELQRKVEFKLYHVSKAFRYFSLMIYEFNDFKLIIGKAIEKYFTLDNFYDIESKKMVIEDLFKDIKVDNLRDYLHFESSNITLLIELLPIDVWIKDKFHKYLYINKSYESNMGYSLKDMFMKDDYELFDEQTASDFENSDRMAIESGKKISYSFYSKNEIQSTWADVTKIPIYNSDGEYIGMLGYGIDTSEGKLMLENLKLERDRFKRVVDNMEGLVFEINAMGETIFVEGTLLKEIRNTGIDMQKDNMFESISNQSLIDEKIKLSLNGTYTEITTEIAGMKLFLKLNPVINDDGTFNVIGTGSIIEE